MKEEHDGSRRYKARLVVKGFQYKEEIKKLKKQLSKEFAMKDLGAAKQIFEMRIVRDRTVGTMELFQEGYIQKVLSRFNMQDENLVNTLLASHFKLSKE